MISKTVMSKLLSDKNCISACTRKTFINNYCVSYFEPSDEVRCALHEKKPLVALESTIITHGMPYPDNIKCAQLVHKIIKQQGAIPATVAIIKGKIKIGLSDDELVSLGDTKCSKPIKTSRRDLSYVICNKLNGGTTVSGTLLVANKIGIPIFATGGIGGVHRDAQQTFDISADLTELGKSNVAVVSSGAKSILDLAKTLEYLETQGVLVCTFGQDNEFPAFYTRKSGYKSPYYTESTLEAARIIKCHRDLEMGSGILFAAPIPAEHALSDDFVNQAIEKALKDAGDKVKGKNITPFLLSEVAKYTSGQSLESNVELVKNNARIAADIAVNLYKLSSTNTANEGTNKKWIEGHKKLPVIIGGSNLDCSAKIDTSEIKLDGRNYSTNLTFRAGGVARNICEAMSKLGFQTNFLSIIGEDSPGNHLKASIPNNCSGFIKTSKCRSTAQCILLFDKVGDLKLMMGDMVIHKDITKDMITEIEHVIHESPLLILDANLSLEAMEEALRLAQKHNVPVFYEPTDISHAVKAFKTSSWRAIKFITPNFEECKQITEFLSLKSNKKFDTHIQEAAHMASQINNYIENVIVTLGIDGVIIARRGALPSESFSENYPESSPRIVRHYPGDIVRDVRNVSGAGDNFASGFAAAAILNAPEQVCMSVGFAAARLALLSDSAVPDKIFNTSHPSWNQKAKYHNIEIV